MEQTRSEDVKRLYERYPFPHGFEKNKPDFLFAFWWCIHFSKSVLTGSRIFDAGCGTGHKLIAMALSMPEANFVGMDLSKQSVKVAGRLAAEYKVSNVELHQGNIMEMTFDEKFDFIQSSGVIHHLENPLEGLKNLGRALKENGIFSLWLYHPIGEFERLNQRELLHTLWGGDRSDLDEGQILMEELGLDLTPKQYGYRERDSDYLVGNADAFMHPIVRAYRFHEALDMLRAAGSHWAAIDFVNMRGAVKYIDLGGSGDPWVGHMCVRPKHLFPSETLQDRYLKLPKKDRLKIIELALQPTGFLVLTGKRPALDKLGKRSRENLIELD